MKNESNNERSWMGAVTFAEAGEWETARAMTPLPRKSRWAEFFEQTMMAVAFAEEGLPEEAKRLAGMKRPQKRINNFLDSIGLRRDVRMTYAILQESATC